MISRPLRLPPHARRFPERMEANLTQILPMYPTRIQDLGTFTKIEPIPYLRTMIIAAMATGFLGLFAACAVSVDRLAEVEKRLAWDARV